MNPYWIESTEYELFKLRDAAQRVAMIPLASIESHGPHLPLGADSLAADAIVKRIVALELVAVLPVVHYSYVAEARSLPGAIHLRSDLLMEMVEQICDEVHRNTFDKIVLLHCHGGNVALHEMFLKRMLEREKPYAVYSIPVGAGAGESLASMFSTETGHACEAETSLDLVTNPHHVNLDALGDKTYPTQPAPTVDAALTPVEWISRHPEMVVGQPQLATSEKGEKQLAVVCDAVAQTLRKIKSDTITLSEMKRYKEQSRNIGKWSAPK